MAATAEEFEISSPPSDGISAIAFAPETNDLLAGSWDATCRLYDVEQNTQVAKVELESPVLDCCLLNGRFGACGTLDGNVQTLDLNNQKAEVIGTHDSGVKCVNYAQHKGLIISGSWDQTISLWDPRRKEVVENAQQPDKVYTMDLSGDRLVVGMAGRHVWIWDLRNMIAPEQRRESSLKYQTRCIRAMPDQQGYVLSSIEGRVAVEYFDPTPSMQQLKYAFKCHRMKVDGQETIFPVNSLAFHPKYGTFATGGCDAMVRVWDGEHKKRLSQFHRYPTSIAAMDFSHDGKYLAIASSYTYEEGEKSHPADAIFIRSVTEEEVKPK